MKSRYYFERQVVREGSMVTSHFELVLLGYFTPKSRWWHPMMEPARVFYVTRVEGNPYCAIREMRPLRKYLKNVIEDDLLFSPSYYTV